MSSGSPDEPSRIAEIARLQMTQVAVSDNQPLPEVFRRLCEIAAEALEVARVGIWLLNTDHTALRCANLFERTSQAHSEGLTLRVADFPIYFETLSVRRALPAEMAQADPRTAELRDAYLVPLGITSILDAPLLRGGEVIGVVCHEHTGPPREWTTEDRDFAMSVADLIVTKIKSAELLLMKAALRHHSAAVATAERLDSLGRLAAGVAHDFNNLLTTMLGNAELILREPELSVVARDCATQIGQAGHRGAALVRELLDFGREGPTIPRVLNVSTVLEEFLPILRAGIGSGHTVSLTHEPGSVKVLIDRGELERAILNLAMNARDAMPVGGVIQIHVAPETITEAESQPMAYVRIDVRDTGGGIPAADREHIFDPLFTTKPAGQGSGLGLAIVRRVVDRAGGFVRVESEMGVGTVFRVYLPRVTNE